MTTVGSVADGSGLQAAAFVFVQRNEQQRERAGNGKDAGGDENTFVPEDGLYDPREDGSEGDEQGAQTGADGVVAGDELSALGDLHEEDEIARKANAVANGFEEDDWVEPDRLGQHIGGPDVKDVGNVHADDQRPEGAAQPDARDPPA